MINIERLAREAGFIWLDDYLIGGSLSAPQPDKPLLQRFAALVRNEVLEEAAKLADEKYQARKANGFPREASTARSLAAAIRALKDKT